jgi:hypothetical protein
MKTSTKFLLLILLPALAALIYPPKTILAGLPLMLIAFVLLGLLGFVVWRGRFWSLRLMIFIQGINVIVHIMMFIPHAKTPFGVLDFSYISASVLSMILSTYLVLRLDRTDIRTLMLD